MPYYIIYNHFSAHRFFLARSIIVARSIKLKENLQSKISFEKMHSLNFGIAYSSKVLNDIFSFPRFLSRSLIVSERGDLGIVLSNFKLNSNVQDHS